MILQSVGYQPYKKEQWKKIKEMWELYKESVGFEGEIGIRLVQLGKNQIEVNGIIEMNRKDVENNLDAWYKLRKES